jgi:DNA (cytosine-5)-methyltransferase 1
VFDKTNQYTLFDNGTVDDKAERSRALVEEIPRYLQAMALRGQPVLVGVMENVIQCRLWDQWDRWIREIESLGYKTRVIAYNSMHASPEATHRAPQSRDRLYVAYWHRKLGRDPDWNKWLRPKAYCEECDETVDAIQVFKKPGQEMGAYKTQYVYLCPNRKCRNAVVEPWALPAAVAIDWSVPGQRIGDRAKPLADKTLARIEAGLHKYAMPITLAAAGHTFERRPGVRTWPVTDPLRTQSTTEQFGLAVPPLLVPVEGRAGDRIGHVGEPIRTQTARAETGLAWLPFITPLSGGGDEGRARPITNPLATFRAGGLHHGLAFSNEWHALLMRNNEGGSEMSTPVSEYMRTLTTKGHQSLIEWRQRLGEQIDVQDVLFRMLEPHEIQRGMAFADQYIVTGSKRDQVRQLGNAVTPPVAELIVSALVETITGEQLERRQSCDSGSIGIGLER